MMIDSYKIIWAVQSAPHVYAITPNSMCTIPIVIINHKTNSRRNITHRLFRLERFIESFNDFGPISATNGEKSQLTRGGFGLLLARKSPKAFGCCILPAFFYSFHLCFFRSSLYVAVCQVLSSLSSVFARQTLKKKK